MLTRDGRLRFADMPVRHTATSKAYRPNWPAEGDFINEEHRTIFEATSQLPGWQDAGDSLKLYEAAYHSGSVILEIGVYGGRSAAVELKGALAAYRDHGGPLPQFYGVDMDRAAFFRSRQTLEDLALAERALLYRGDLRQFFHDIPIVPTLVFVDGSHEYEGVWADLDALSRIVAPGTPVICHDFWNVSVPGVRAAIEEWVGRGAFEYWGATKNTAVLRASDACRGGAPRGLTEATFRATADALAARYRQQTAPGPRPDVAHLTHHARRELGAAAV